jgi:hypothetical protein
MNRSNYISLAAAFIILGLLQVTVLKNLVLGNYSSCFIYILPLLLIPLEVSAIALMATGFLYGISIDTFYDTPGIHAASAVLIMYLRPGLIRILTPGGGYDAGTQISAAELGWGWVLSYLIPLIFIHHVALFFIEAGNLGMFWVTLGKATMSSIFTLVVSLIILYIRMPQKGSRL